MKNCNTCVYFWKHNWNDGRKGLCEATDTTPSKMEGKNCKHYKPKKYNRISTIVQQRISEIATQLSDDTQTVCDITKGTKMKNCFTEAIKQKLDKMYLLIYFDRIAFPHFIYEYNSNFYHYTTEKERFNSLDFEGKIEKLDIVKYKKCAKFLMLKIMQRSHDSNSCEIKTSHNCERCVKFAD